MTPRLHEAFAVQAESCRSLGSPFMQHLMGILPDLLLGTAIGARMDAWEGELGPSGASLPLRLAGGLHALVLSGDPLAEAYPPGGTASLGPAVADALIRREAELMQALDSAPQTNEIRRSAALLPGAALLADRHGLPFDLIEVGASAGLNTVFDRYAVEAGGVTVGAADPLVTLRPDWRGPAPPTASIEAASHAGCDLAPIDVSDPAQRLRLLSYLWPDQPERRALTEAAIAGGPPLPQRSDAVAFLKLRLAPRRGRMTLLFHTVAWQYLSEVARAEGDMVIAAAGARARDDAPLARLSMESDGGRGAALTLTTWPGGGTESLGRADFHGRWVEWTG